VSREEDKVDSLLTKDQYLLIKSEEDSKECQEWEACLLRHSSRECPQCQFRCHPCKCREECSRCNKCHLKWAKWVWCLEWDLLKLDRPCNSRDSRITIP
jgi:hypothetical protein